MDATTGLLVLVGAAAAVLAHRASHTLGSVPHWRVYEKASAAYLGDPCEGARIVPPAELDAAAAHTAAIIADRERRAEEMNLRASRRRQPGPRLVRRSA
ncbi:MAG: hypothetical protein AB7H81_23665 [Vicinamibacterales bacterium]